MKKSDSLDKYQSTWSKLKGIKDKQKPELITFVTQFYYFYT